MEPSPDEGRPRLGPPLEHGVSTIPERWRLPLLIVVIAGCVTIFLASIVYAVWSR